MLSGRWWNWNHKYSKRKWVQKIIMERSGNRSWGGLWDRRLLQDSILRTFDIKYQRIIYKLFLRTGKIRSRKLYWLNLLKFLISFKKSRQLLSEF